jgi:hypothetical protein
MSITSLKTFYPNIDVDNDGPHEYGDAAHSPAAKGPSVIPGSFSAFHVGSQERENLLASPVPMACPTGQ